MASTGDKTTIVVGVDGSEAASAALRWALDEARLRGATLRVVHAWSFPSLSVLPIRDLPTPAELLQHANDVIRKSLSEVGERGDVKIEPCAVEGSAAAALVHTAADADLLVVGARGRGGFGGLLLGSVSQQCAHHAPCPIVIVGSPRGHDAGGGA